MFRDVILSVAIASQREAIAESKDPYTLNFSVRHQGVLPLLANARFTTTIRWFWRLPSSPPSALSAV